MYENHAPTKAKVLAKILTLQGELLKLHLPFYAQDKESTRRNVVPINN